MDLLQGLTIAVFVLLALAGTLVVLQKRGWVRTNAPAGVARRLQTLERVSLTPQHSIHLVRVDDRILVVASAPGGCSLLEIEVKQA